MRKYKLLTIAAVLVVSVLTMSACVRRTSHTETNMSEGDMDELNVMSDTLKEKYLNAEEGEMLYVTIRLQDDIDLKAIEDKAWSNAGITEEERSLIDGKVFMGMVEREQRDDALKRIRREKFTLICDFYENMCEEFIVSEGISTEKIGGIANKSPRMDKVDLTKEEITSVALRPEVVYMDFYDCRRPPVIKIDTGKYDHMLSAAYWERDTILRPLMLNKDKIEERGYGIGITKFDTLEELNEFKSNYTEALSLDTSQDEVKSFNTNTSKYDEQFFEDNTLIAIFYGSNSCSLRYSVYDIVSDGNKVCFEVTETTARELVDCGMAEWIITITVPDEEVAVWNDYDVVYVDGQE